MNRWTPIFIILLLAGCPTPDTAINQPATASQRYEDLVPFRPNWWERNVVPGSARETYIRRAQEYNARQAQIDALQTETELQHLKVIQEKVKVLRLGMSQEQVGFLLGKPTQTQVIETKMVWKYAMSPSSKFPISYYLIFDGSPLTLQGWFAAE